MGIYECVYALYMAFVLIFLLFNVCMFASVMLGFEFGQFSNK